MPRTMMGEKWRCFLRLIIDSGLPSIPGRRGENDKKVVRHDEICVSDLSVFLYCCGTIFCNKWFPTFKFTFCFWPCTDISGTSLLYCRAVHEHKSLPGLMVEMKTASSPYLWFDMTMQQFVISKGCALRGKNGETHFTSSIRAVIYSLSLW